MISKKFSTTKKDDMIWSHLCRSQTWVGSLMSQPPASKKRHANLEKNSNTSCICEIFDFQQITLQK